MDVQLKLSHQMTVQHKIDAPCEGVVAKALGKYKLEEAFPGWTVKFKSYQRAAGAPEENLGDDQHVQRNSILNFTVNLEQLMKRVAQHEKLLKGLYVPMLETLVSKFTDRLLGNDVTEATSGRLAERLAASEDLAAVVSAVLTSVGSDETAVAFAQSLDDVYKNQNDGFMVPNVCEIRGRGRESFSHGCPRRSEEQHVNTKNQLRTEFKQLHDAGVHELLADEMPAACLVVEHFDDFLQLLP